MEEYMRKIYFLLLLLFIPTIVYAEDYLPNGDSGILIEANSGKILYEKDKDKRVSVASLTKMVAQTIILEEIEANKIHWDDIVVVSKNASDMGGSQIYLSEGEKISVSDLMKGISVASGNDAVVAMAEYISGSEVEFVKRMNEVVARLELKNTHFVNCTGLDEKDHYSSSYDMAMIARELVLNHPDILKFSSIYEDYLREDTEQKFWLVNTNKLIHFYEGADGLKTGHTDDAGYCLAATAKRKSLRLIAIVLGEKDNKVRNQEVMNLLDYGFQSVQMNCIMKKGDLIEKRKILKGNRSTLEIVLQEDLCVLEKKNDRNVYDYDVKISQYDFPVVAGKSIGYIDVLSDKKLISRSPLTSKYTILKEKYPHFIISNLMSLFSGNL